MTEFSISPELSGQKISDILRKEGIYYNAPCGGRGVCGKCTATLLSGNIRGKDGKIIASDAGAEFLLCKAYAGPEGAKIIVKQPDGSGLTTDESESCSDSSSESFLVLDVGTTTLAMALSDKNGRVVKTASQLNPQMAFGADVISRISAAGNGELSAMTDAIINGANELISQLTSDTKKDLYVVGNTTMMHIFCGISPVSIGRYPFTPVFTQRKVFEGFEKNINAGKVTVLDCASGYIGSDITAGMLRSGFGDKISDMLLLLDIGTNGEMALKINEKCYCTSTAAGPAFEGANISCGMGGVPGAVSHISSSADGSYTFSTIGSEPARGLSGTGLVDFVSTILSEGLVDETGYIVSDEDDVSLCDQCGNTITLTSKDIREVQLAKSAIRAGIVSLLGEAGETPESFIEKGGKVILAGGLGFYLDTKSAIRIGLLPEEFSGHIEIAGNTALKGGIKAGISIENTELLKKIAQQIEIVDLDKSEIFRDAFIEYMYFPE